MILLLPVGLTWMSNCINLIRGCVISSLPVLKLSKQLLRIYRAFASVFVYEGLKELLNTITHRRVLVLLLFQNHLSFLTHSALFEAAILLNIQLLQHFLLFHYLFQHFQIWWSLFHLHLLLPCILIFRSHYVRAVIVMKQEMVLKIPVCWEPFGFKQWCVTSYWGSGSGIHWQPVVIQDLYDLVIIEPVQCLKFDQLCVKLPHFIQ